MEETVKRKINSLIYKACILVVISFVGIALVIRGDIIGEKDILYALGGTTGMISAIFAGMICFFVLGVKKGIEIGKVENGKKKYD